MLVNFSGGITSREKFNMQYGAMAATIKVPRGPDFWPGFWVQATGFPIAADQLDCGEMDIFEMFGMPFSHQSSLQDHCWNSNGQGHWGYAAFPLVALTIRRPAQACRPNSTLGGFSGQQTPLLVASTTPPSAHISYHQRSWRRVLLIDLRLILRRSSSRSWSR
jgi:hypothetical protein